MRKTVLIFDHYSVPPSRPGFSRHHDHATYRATAGWDTRIVASSFNHKTQDNEKSVSLLHPWRDADEDGVEFRWIYTFPYRGNNWRRYVNMLSYLMIAPLALVRSEKPDVVIGVSPHLLAALAGWIVARRFRVPFIFEVQDLWPDSLVQLGLSNPGIIKVLRSIEHHLYKQADAIVTLTDGISDGVSRATGDSSKIILIPNGATVAEPLDSRTRDERRAARGWENSWVAIWAGAHGRANHLETIIEAARTLHETEPESRVRLVLMGDGPEKPQLMSMAQGLPNVEFLDAVAKNKVPEMLQLADVGLIVHRDTEAVRGARPTKLSEYMGASLPIISNLQGECARLIAEADCGWTVDTMNPSQLASAIRQSANHAAFAKNKGVNGSRYLRETHDRKLLAHRMWDVLESIARR